ncbi:MULTISPECIES: alpha/beta fold hydrolase [unclassified Streptomyces]|uniref:alpha/beta fold hydrolase n=1 Tax=unclassified Streptomyces TaxID=2593676 RepID=UPI0016564291|nr:alpha/beta fold hydrolase [Streptomyces sp. CB02980]MCB8901005.1 alpha/beta hydrolase [Streptomyces sp. CB02980]
MTFLTRAATTVAAALTAVVCASSAPGATPAPYPSVPTVPSAASHVAPGLTDPRPCPGQTDVTCADLTVPLDRTGAMPGTLKLQTAVFGTADAPRGTLLFLTGGPGQPGVPFVQRIRERLPEALAQYRLVMIDQRGTGGAAVDCPQLQAEVGSSDTVVPTPGAVTACAKNLGVNRNFYTTADTVADLEDLRRALGVGSWTLDGVSYGTFTAGRYALTHPHRVRALVLDSVVPLDGAGVLYENALGHSARVLRTACREQGCGFDPARDLATVVRRDGNGVGVFNLLVIASIIDPKLDNPRFGILGALHASAAGDRARLDGLVAGFSAPSDEPPSEFSSGLHAATLCADSRWPWGDASAPAEGREQALKRAVQRIRPAAVWPFERKTAGAQGIPQTCLPWPSSRPDQAVPRRTLTMPVLILAGDRDLSTPVQWARDLASVTPRAELVVLAGAGHSTQSRSDGGARAAEEFLLRQAH